MEALPRHIFNQKIIFSCFLFLSLTAPLAQASYKDQVVLGDFVTTDLGLERGFTISGRAMIVRRGDGTTEAYSQVLGLTPLTTFASHIHDLPCSLGGGAHYKIDPLVVGTVRENEIWPELNADESGVGYGFNKAEHWARPEAQSIVVHDPADGSRIACADVVRNDKAGTIHRGHFIPLAAAVDLELDISGVAQMVRSNETTYVTTTVEGLEPSTDHMVHVHNLPCDVSNGGAHYKIDPFEPATIQANEIWPAFTTDDNGVGVGSEEALHLARPEAQSVVVHASNGDRLACAHLTSKQSEAAQTRGDFLTTAAGLARGFDIKGSVVMQRKSTGSTFVFSKVKGLQRHVTYAAHVHNLPCRLGGGSHYKINASESNTIEANEIWLPLKAKRRVAIGFGSARRHAARPEAQSVVIHDPEDGARLACADLD